MAETAEDLYLSHSADATQDGQKGRDVSGGDRRVWGTEVPL